MTKVSKYQFDEVLEIPLDAFRFYSASDTANYQIEIFKFNFLYARIADIFW